LLARAAPDIDGRVVLLGPAERGLGSLPECEVLQWFSRATVFAEPARYEPFGLAALEAALSGCALVLGDIPSLREVWGNAATFVSPEDPDALAAAVNALLDDPARASQAARARAARYTPIAMGGGYVDAYDAVAA
jgi:glycosyltransferase involved in cell wall biosynthesis